MTHRVRRLAVLGALSAAASLALAPSIIAGAAARHADQVSRVRSGAAADPLPTLVQATADMPPQVPATPSCTVTLSHHVFGNSYYAPDTGAYAPPAACPGPWSRVILTLSSTVDGVQFDRSLTVSVGSLVLLHGTTSEPCCSQGLNAVTWTVQRDVTADSTVLEQPGTYAVQLDNVNTSTYTGQYDTTVTLTYYETGAGAPAPDVAPFDVPVTSGDPANEEYTIGANGQTPGRAESFPRNLDFLTADLFTDGQGPCEEFWWSEPGQCSTGTPYREVAIYLDGRLAGAAPVYPTVFTGGDGPGLWEPIPSPRTWDLRPYSVDLTPFVGLLTDGAPHEVTLGVLDSAIGSGDFWPVAATLHGWVDPNATQVTGTETDTNPPAPTDDTSGSTPATYSDNALHTLTFTGVLGAVEAGGDRWLVPYTVTDRLALATTEDAAGLTTDSSWSWSTESSLGAPATGAGTAPPPAPLVTADTLTTGAYSIVSSGLTHFSFTDNAHTTVTDLAGHQAWSEYDDSMDTSGPTGLATNGVEDNTYRDGDSAGTCYDRTLTAAGTGLYQSADGPFCPGAAPAASVPESPAAVMLPTGAMTLLVVSLVAPPRRRRRRTAT